MMLPVVRGEQPLDDPCSASVTAGLPVAAILVSARASLVRALRREHPVAGLGPASARAGAAGVERCHPGVEWWPERRADEPAKPGT